MLPELGQFALIISLCFAFGQSILPLWGIQSRNRILTNYSVTLVSGQFFFLLLAFIILTLCFLQNDFSVAYVAKTSNLSLPVQYKISAVWGGHEGSMLLWVLMLAGWSFAVAMLAKDLPIEMRARVLSVLGMISVGFLLFVVLTSNPFDRLLPNAPADGQDLNPLLQDIGLIVHPPMLYMGYVGFAVSFAFAIAALLTGRLDSAWTKWIRPWANAAWASLTIGIMLGSWWAYYELGWGGWWFWDPVENASFMPWLVGTALIHSLAVSEKRGNFKSWTILLAILAFSLSLLGTFLVRSGVITSVHAFATDPERGVFILALLGICVGGSLLLFALRSHTIRSVSQFEWLSRESFLIANNILLVVSCATILLGTLYPLIVDALGQGKMSIGPPYFNLLFVPLMAMLMALVAVGAMSRWKAHDGDDLIKKIWWLLPTSVAFGLILTFTAKGEFNFQVAIGLTLGIWVVAVTFRDLYDKIAHRKNKWLAIKNLSGSYKGMIVAHLGIAVTALGICVVSNFTIEKDIRMAPGESVDVYGYTFKFMGASGKQGPNYVANVGQFELYKDGKFIEMMLPEKRRYQSGGNIMTEADIDAGFTRDLYVALGEPLKDGAWAVRIHIKPMVRWIWLGAIMMAWGGVWAMMDKRYRRRKENKLSNDRALAEKGEAVA